MESRTCKVAVLLPSEASLTAIAQEGGGYASEAASYVRSLIGTLREEILEIGTKLGFTMKIKNIQLFDIEEETTRMIDRERGRPIGSSDIMTIVNPSARQLGAVLQYTKANAFQRAVIGSTEPGQISVIRQLSLANEIPVIKKGSNAYGIVRKIVSLDLSKPDSIGSDTVRNWLRRTLLFPEVSQEDAISKQNYFSIALSDPNADESQPEARTYFVEQHTDRKDKEERDEYVRTKIQSLGLE